MVAARALVNELSGTLLQFGAPLVPVSVPVPVAVVPAPVPVPVAAVPAVAVPAVVVAVALLDVSNLVPFRPAVGIVDDLL
ncbi:hypothetical protein BDB00DRAFT_800407 [Zychaea mexicana]|uniref:uncharacterized protein n=1 Tax=Zychaea mexicana TaxID=64656 RepID=UPI0022FDE3B2|nr:uncharacterized protein BDB00DRAFT_800407 [Zychaea mexicana]KAI9498468.1 hypothetical protein BDB00DRAFT_800407 [Zychaea mexicana]